MAKENRSDATTMSEKNKKPSMERLIEKGIKKNKYKKKRRTQQQESSIRYTEEGFRIYSVEELKKDQPVNLKGECPFDCNCCF